ncbi:MAG: spore protease YyaC [Lachnospiraceae bacterium]|nr:spore protease YyaC [Lachnospiraceae bacterium]
MSGLIEAAKKKTGKERVLYLCIGSDRSTGDSLGPLVGHQLCRMVPTGTLVLGTLRKPVHAVNLKATMDFIRSCCSNYLVVAVDASVGREDHVGGITLGLGSIRPGLGVCKKLQEVGDIYITGVVHSGDNLEPELLQSTRLALVMELAECISLGISCRNIF